MMPGPSFHEKRSEPRRPAQGAVTVRVSNHRPAEIHGQLVDVSASGFRMEHRDSSLEGGQLVEFSHPTASGSARVMWNRILDHRVETGFLIVAPK